MALGRYGVLTVAQARKEARVLLAEAAKDARTRAENMVHSAGGATIHNLRSADMGIININPANSSDTSAEGNNDTTSLEKDIITIVHVSYELR